MQEKPAEGFQWSRDERHSSGLGSFKLICGLERGDQTGDGCNRPGAHVRLSSVAVLVRS